jgi:hypothetical protein
MLASLLLGAAQLGVGAFGLWKARKKPDPIDSMEVYNVDPTTLAQVQLAREESKYGFSPTVIQTMQDNALSQGAQTRRLGLETSGGSSPTAFARAIAAQSGVSRLFGEIQSQSEQLRTQKRQAAMQDQFGIEQLNQAHTQSSNAKTFAQQQQNDRTEEMWASLLHGGLGTVSEGVAAMGDWKQIKQMDAGWQDIYKNAGFSQGFDWRQQRDYLRDQRQEVRDWNRFQRRTGTSIIF